MCRLYSQISLKTRSAEDFLVDSERSLPAPEQRPAQGLPSRTGWGIGYFNGTGPRVTKSSGAAFKEAARFKSAANKARSKIVIGHLRAGLEPDGLKQARIDETGECPALHRRALHLRP